MIGKLIEKARKSKNITKTELSKITGINIGHLTHIEKEERNPSHKALEEICKALCIPYQELLYTYDKEIDEEHENYDYLKHIPYDKIPLFKDLDGFITCPSEFNKASFAMYMPDSSMDPLIPEKATIFVEQAPVLNHKDIGLFKLNNNFYVRKLMFKRNKFILKAANKSFKDINVSANDDFIIIGKIYV